MFEDCEYPSFENPSQVQLLEEQISAIKSRIRAVEVPEQVHTVNLYHPYTSDDAFNSRPSSSSSSFGEFYF